MRVPEPAPQYQVGPLSSTCAFFWSVVILCVQRNIRNSHSLRRWWLDPKETEHPWIGFPLFLCLAAAAGWKTASSLRRLSMGRSMVMFDDNDDNDGDRIVVSSDAGEGRGCEWVRGDSVYHMRQALATCFTALESVLPCLASCLLKPKRWETFVRFDPTMLSLLLPFIAIEPASKKRRVLTFIIAVALLGEPWNGRTLQMWPVNYYFFAY